MVRNRGIGNHFTWANEALGPHGTHERGGDSSLNSKTRSKAKNNSLFKPWPENTSPSRRKSPLAMTEGQTQQFKHHRTRFNFLNPNPLSIYFNSHLNNQTKLKVLKNPKFINHKLNTHKEEPKPLMLGL